MYNNNNNVFPHRFLHPSPRVRCITTVTRCASSVAPLSYENAMQLVCETAVMIGAPRRERKFPYVRNPLKEIAFCFFSSEYLRRQGRHRGKSTRAKMTNENFKSRCLLNQLRHSYVVVVRLFGGGVLFCFYFFENHIITETEASRRYLTAHNSTSVQYH